MPASLSSQAQDLLHHARSSTPFCSKDGQPCASLPIEGGHRTVVALRSAAFRDWLIAEYYNGNATAPSTAAFNAALRTLEARARYGDFPITPVTQRLAFEGDPYLPNKIILDLANPEGEVLEITSRNWTTRNNLKTAFKKSPTTLPLPIPTTDHRRPTTDNRPPITDNRPPTTDHRQPPTDNHQPTTDNRPPTTDNRPPTTDHRHQPTTDNRPPTTDNHQPPATNHSPHSPPSSV